MGKGKFKLDLKKIEKRFKEGNTVGAILEVFCHVAILSLCYEDLHERRRNGLLSFYEFVRHEKN